MNWVKNAFSIIEKAIKDYGLCGFMALAQFIDAQKHQN
jgi:hypothetical protein